MKIDEQGWIGTICFSLSKNIKRKWNKCNIEIANEVFNLIRSKLDLGEPVTVTTFNIKGLDHHLLKQS